MIFDYHQFINSRFGSQFSRLTQQKLQNISVMQTLPTSELSIMVPEQQSSRLYPPPWTKQQLQSLRLQLLGLLSDFQRFKESTLSEVKEQIGRISALFYRSLKQRVFLEAQLDKSRQVQNSMREQVIQLKQMINEAMSDYAKDLEAKEREIRLLKARVPEPRQSNHQESVAQEIKIEEEFKSEKDESLEIIQEESEQATFSSGTSLREFKEDQSKSSQQSSKQEISIVPQSHFKFIDPQGKPSTPSQTSVSGNPKAKSFIDNFRKTIQESFHQNECQSHKHHEKSMPFIPKLNLKQQNKENQNVVKVRTINEGSSQNCYSRSLKDIGNIQERQFYTNSLKDKGKQQESQFPKTFYLHQKSPQISNSNSSSELGNLSEVERESEVNPVKHLQTPNYTFMKKKSTFFHQRFKTEPDHPVTSSVNNYYSHNPANSYSKIDRKPACQRSFSDSKTAKTSGSKQKIKVTARMLDEMSYQPRKNHNASAAKALVHLGGKSQFRKFLFDLKNAFRKYNIDIGSALEEFQYEGQLRNKQRWGRGRLLYRNGFVYEGQFQRNKRHGRGSIFLNGISIYEGQWAEDKLEGQGYIKSMKFTTANCPGLFKEASYCGNLRDGKLHGIGTIFLNQKQKIVTKFSEGCPIGELTYYNLHEIEFGVWPAQ